MGLILKSATAQSQNTASLHCKPHIKANDKSGDGRIRFRFLCLMIRRNVVIDGIAGKKLVKIYLISLAHAISRLVFV